MAGSKAAAIPTSAKSCGRSLGPCAAVWARMTYLVALGALACGGIVALGDLEAVDLAGVYGLPTDDPDASLAIAAVTLRPGFELDAGALATALGALDEGERPDVVHVVDEIPVTTWYRPNAAALRAADPPARVGTREV